jgi:hypothetical protein
MVCGILAHKKEKRERLKPLFLYAGHFPCDNRPEGLELQASYPSGGFFWPPQLRGLNELS